MIDQSSVRDSRFDVKAWMVFVFFAAVFLSTASFDEASSIDPEANALTAFLLAQRGSPFAAEYEEIVELPRGSGGLTWFVDTPDGPASQYPPGSALLAVPLYLFADDELNIHADLSALFDGRPVYLLLPDMWPAAVTAALISAVGIASLFWVVRELGVSQKNALVGTSLFGLGTAVWTVAADSLWQHGPAMATIALVMVAALRRNAVLIFILAILAVLIRPPAAIIVCSIALGASLQLKHRHLVVAAVLGSSLGAVILSTYNRWVFGSFGISGGYNSAFMSRVLDPDLEYLASNWYGAVFAADKGVATWSPIFAAAVLVVPIAWGQIPTLIRWTMLGALSYLTVQYLANNYRGGLGFAYYRYPIEAMAAVFPAAVIALSSVARGTLRINQLLLVLMAQWSVLVHFIAAAGLR